MSKSTDGYDKPLISNEERKKVERFMERLGFHLEQNHKTPATLRKDELWMSNDTEDQVFYPHNIHQDLAAHLYQTFDQECAKRVEKACSFVIGRDEPQEANGLLPDRVDRRNQLRSEQRERLATLNNQTKEEK